MSPLSLPRGVDLSREFLALLSPYHAASERDIEADLGLDTARFKRVLKTLRDYGWTLHSTFDQRRGRLVWIDEADWPACQYEAETYWERRYEGRVAVAG